MLPKEEIYRPPLNIKVIDHRAFGNKPLVGVHVINDISKFDYDPMQSQSQVGVTDSIVTSWYSF